MGKVGIGINMEFVRHHDLPFEWGVEKAAEMGYEYIEPMVHWGRELMSEAGYFHYDLHVRRPARHPRACEKSGSSCSACRAHTPLGRPDVGVQLPASRPSGSRPSAGAPVVNTDEGPKPPWTTSEEDHVADEVHADRGRGDSPSAAAS